MAVPEFDAIQNDLKACRPYHLDRDKSRWQRRLERAGNWTAGVMLALVGLMVSMAIWKKLELPLGEGLLHLVRIWAAISPAIAALWLACGITAELLGRRHERRKPPAVRQRDIHLRTALHDEQYARQLLGYSHDALVRTEHYLACRIQDVAWIGSLRWAKIVGAVVSAAPFVLRHQIDPAEVSRYVRVHGIVTTELLVALLWSTAMLASLLWGLSSLRKRHSQDSYRRAIVALALRFQQARRLGTGTPPVGRSRAAWRSWQTARRERN
ncbi:hypothetical protein WT03_10630 [Burkholderia stagnalis]|nr:hypothetical protein WT03_10630 [Burkholderia stagnalis]